MTKLEQAFLEAAQLPQAEQEVLAAWILEEIHTDLHWAKLLAGSEDVLSLLADEALAEYRAGKTELLDPEAL